MIQSDRLKQAIDLVCVTVYQSGKGEVLQLWKNVFSAAYNGVAEQFNVVQRRSQTKEQILKCPKHSEVRMNTLMGNCLVCK